MQDDKQIEVKSLVQCSYLECPYKRNCLHGKWHTEEFCKSNKSGCNHKCTKKLNKKFK